MPQSVESVAGMAKSPTVQTGTVAAGVGVVSVFSEAGQHLGTVGTVAKSAKDVIVDTLGVPSGALLPLLLTMFGGIVVWRRFRQRIQGWV
jgi:hypothetical protein